MGVVESVTAAVTPVLGALGVELVDVEHRGAVVRVVVDEHGGIGLDRVAEVTQAVSRALDEADPLPGRYTLEVSSPGLERPLRTPAHFRQAVGRKVTVKTTPAFPGERRLVGELLAATDDRVVVRAEGAGDAEVPLEQVERARTVFDWGPPPKPGKGSRPGAAKRSTAKPEGGGRAAGSPGAGAGAGAGGDPEQGVGGGASTGAGPNSRAGRTGGAGGG
jgi:ribosome maturation factor RimP